MTPRRTLACLVAVAVLVPGALAACSDDDDDASSTTEASSSALPPVIVEVGSLDGSTVEVPEGGAIDVTGDDETYTDWTAEIADPAIVELHAGSRRRQRAVQSGLRRAGGRLDRGHDDELVERRDVDVHRRRHRCRVITNDAGRVVQR